MSHNLVGREESPREGGSKVQELWRGQALDGDSGAVSGCTNLLNYTFACTAEFTTATVRHVLYIPTYDITGQEW